jgi:hypothetical protein
MLTGLGAPGHDAYQAQRVKLRVKINQDDVIWGGGMGTGTSGGQKGAGSADGSSSKLRLLCLVGVGLRGAVSGETAPTRGRRGVIAVR